jgi:RHS repeat-associated protein
VTPSDSATALAEGSLRAHQVVRLGVALARVWQVALQTQLFNTGDLNHRNEFGEIDRYQAGFNDQSCAPSGPPSIGCFNVLDQIFQRDAAGRITQKTETLRNPITRETETHAYVYSYDLAGRLTAVTRDGLAWESYSYDTNGNRTSWTDPWGSGTATYDPQDRLLTYGNRSYAYTLNGELSTKTQGGQSNGYTYDALGDLLAVNLAGGTQISYVVDGLNRRIGKKVGGSLVVGLLYGDGPAPLAQLDGTGKIVSSFIYGTGNAPDALIQDGVSYRIVTDHLGSVRWVINAKTGAVAQRLDYDVFGRVMLDTSPGFQPFGFAGGLYDYQTGLVRFGARDYDAETGRWTSKDPVGFDGGDTNLYGYALADPVNLTDADGLAVGAPGFWEGAIPIWGSGRAAIDDFQTGHPIYGTLQAGLAISDVFLVKSVVTGVAKLAGKGVGRLFAKQAVELAAVQVNRAAGLAAERRAVQELVAEEHKILGTHVAARTSQGLRVIDILTETATGEIVAYEVKSGKGMRTAMQLARDKLMSTAGVVLVGKNAPSGLQGQLRVIRTIERTY